MRRPCAPPGGRKRGSEAPFTGFHLRWEGLPEVKIARAREGLGGQSPPRKQPASGEGLGGLRPPKNTYFHSGVVRRSRMDD